MTIQDEQQTAERNNQRSYIGGGIYFNAEQGKKYYDNGLDVRYRTVGNSRWKTPTSDFKWPDIVKGREIRYDVRGQLR